MPGRLQEQSPGVGDNLKRLREQRQLSIRELAAAARVAPSLVSRIEAGKTSPTVMSLQRILNALDVSFHEFFADPGPEDPSDQIVFPRAGMPVSKDADHRWVHALPRHPQIGMAISHEDYLPSKAQVETTQHNNDIAGIVLSGVLTIEIPGRGVFRVKTGDAFYIKAGTQHISRNDTAKPVKLVCVMLR